MKINAVYDKTGRIVAASIKDEKYGGPVPVAGKDQEAAALDVPADFGSAALADICLGLRVDMKAKALMKR